MSKHTPGPWVADFHYPSISAPTAPDLALCNDHAIPMSERSANARLIAAAPELLELLREAAGYTRHPDYDWPVEFSRRVDAAIAKATGEQP